MSGLFRSDVQGYMLAVSQVRRGYDEVCGQCGEFCDDGQGPCVSVRIDHSQGPHLILTTSHGAGVSDER